MYIWFFSILSLILRYISSSWYQPTPYRSKVRSNFDRWIVCFTTRVINSVSEHFPTRDEQIYILSAPRIDDLSSLKIINIWLGRSQLLLTRKVNVWLARPVNTKCKFFRGPPAACPQLLFGQQKTENLVVTEGRGWADMLAWL